MAEQTIKKLSKSHLVWSQLMLSLGLYDQIDQVPIQLLPTCIINVHVYLFLCLLISVYILLDFKPQLTCDVGLIQSHTEEEN